MVQVLVERYKCPPDKPEKVCGVNVVLLGWLINADILL